MLPIGENIRKLRGEQGITQEQLADHLRVSYQAVSKWENQTTQPDIALLPDIASFFGVKIDELFQPNMTAYSKPEERLIAIYSIEHTDETYAKAFNAYERMEVRGDAAPHDRFNIALLHRLHALDEERKAEDGFHQVINELEETRGVDYYHAHKQLLKMYERTGRTAEGVEMCEAALAREKHIHDRYVLMAIAYENAKAYECALKVSQDGLARFPDDAELILCKASAEFKLDHYAEAIEASERAFSLDPEMAPCLHMKADALMAANRITETAAVWYQIAEWLSARHFDVETKWAEGVAYDLEQKAVSAEDQQ